MYRLIAAVFLLLIIVFIMSGCGERQYSYNGGYIWFEKPKQIPQLPPDCGPVFAPEEWEPAACSDTCCIWEEQLLSKFSVTSCSYEWCYNEWECKWEHILTRCEGE